MLDFILAFMEASPGKYDVSCVPTLISVGGAHVPEDPGKSGSALRRGCPLC